MQLQLNAIGERSICGMILAGDNLSAGRKTCGSATLSTVDLRRTDLYGGLSYIGFGFNMARRDCTGDTDVSLNHVSPMRGAATEGTVPSLVLLSRKS